MAHTKAGGSKANQGSNVKGKRRGVKKFSSEAVIPGNIIVRQKGTKFHPGLNVGMGRDFTIYSKISGIVKFRRLTKTNRGKFAIDVEKQ
ncbi:50S ribosomal protein L27 [Patescibacteria group bacterium]|nr:50S ribosomal protein L27 [Patescibacteria group bacterium]